MYGALSFAQNADGTYDLLIQYNKNDTEFGLDFLSPVKDGYESIAAFLAKHAKGMKVAGVKIMVGGLVMAALPISMLFPAYASSRYSMGYLYVGNATQQIQFVENTQNALQTVSPSYFDLKADGSLKLNTPSRALIDKMHASGIRVVPFVSNHWDRPTGVAALQNYEALADQIADAVQQYGLDGVNVDIENVTHTERDLYSDFVALLREKIPEEKEVSVAVAANPYNYTTGWHGSYDYQALAESSDYLMLMTYDEHYQGGEAGPVASIGFVEDSIAYALEHTTADKIVVGLPLFGRIWSEDGSFQGNSVPMDMVSQIVAAYGAEVTYDEEAQSPKAEFTIEEDDTALTVYGRTLIPGDYVLWYEDEASIGAKLELVDRYDLKGTGSWGIGNEDTSIWTSYNEWLGATEALPEDIENPPDEGKPVTPPPTTLPSPPPTWISSGGGGGSKGGGGGGGGGGSSGGGSSIAFVANNAAVVPAKRQATISVADTVLYGGPSTSNKPLATLPAGTTATILSDQPDWYNITLSDGKTGFVAKSNLFEHIRGVATRPVSIYTKGDSTAPLAAAVKPGTSMTVLQEYASGWSRVRLEDGKAGYAATAYLAKTNATGPVEIKQATTALRLRQTPSADAKSLGAVQEGQTVLVLERGPQYTKVAYGNTTAYVTNGYLR